MDPTTRLAINGGSPTMAPGSLPSWPMPTKAARQRLTDAFESGEWCSASGTRVAEFERAFATYHRATDAVAMVNGTLAIDAALMAVGVNFGDEVIVPSYTFFASAAAVLSVGGVPIFADVDPSNHLLDPDVVEELITVRTKAIIVVHIAGNIPDMDAIMEISARYGIPVVEDAAQAVGAAHRDRPAGTMGAAGTFSFQGSKNLTSGEGGLVTTVDKQIADTVRSYCNVGRVPGGGWYQHENFGFNLRMTEFQGAILLEGLRALPEQQRRRAYAATVLRDNLADCPGLQLDAVNPDVTAHGQHLFIFRVPELGRSRLRDRAVDALRAEGVERASAGYVPLHSNAALTDRAKLLTSALGIPWQPRACPRAEMLASDTIWLPQQYLLGSDSQLEDIARAIWKVVTCRAELEQA